MALSPDKSLECGLGCLCGQTWQLHNEKPLSRYVSCPRLSLSPRDKSMIFSTKASVYSCSKISKTCTARLQIFDLETTGFCNGFSMSFAFPLMENVGIEATSLDHQCLHQRLLAQFVLGQITCHFLALELLRHKLMMQKLNKAIHMEVHCLPAHVKIVGKPLKYTRHFIGFADLTEFVPVFPRHIRPAELSSARHVTTDSNQLEAKG